MNLLSIENLKAGYKLKNYTVEAVNNVSLEVQENEFLGIVGESGCGKSTLALAVIRLLPFPGEIFSGSIRFKGKNIITLPENDLRRIRWKEISIVFQSSMNCLNPVKKIKDQMSDVMIYHDNHNGAQSVERISKALELVNVSPKYLEAYPHQLSGGMKQRVVIAMALLLKPSLIIMDEPTTALDVVVQRKILQDLEDLRKELGFAVIFITHDFSLLIEISDTIAVMYAGTIVEKAPSYTIFSRPLHPYTYGLINSFPPLTGERKRREGIPGNPPDLSTKIEGCPFFERCSKHIEGVCEESEPPNMEIENNHTVKCHLYNEGKFINGKNSKWKGNSKKH